MDKLLAVFFILLLFFIPLWLRQTPESTNASKGTTEKADCHVHITVAGEDKPLNLEDYVVGVVAAEMPITFHEEALKAQAVAARTYALRTTDNGQKPIAADVSAQVYKTKEERKKRWGKDFKRNEEKIRAAVEATAGQIIVYEDQMISAMFFSTSNGQTETALNFSGSEIAYLQSVESPGEEDIAPKFKRQLKLPLAEWNEALGTNWTTDQFKSLQLVRNSSGRVQQVITTNFEMGGREMRQLLGLASTDFNIAFDLEKEIVHVSTVGYGHGVGMSQYGAEAFARKGWTAENILLHYYKGTEIKNFTLSESECLKTP